MRWLWPAIAVAIFALLGIGATYRSPRQRRTRSRRLSRNRGRGPWDAANLTA